MELNELREQSVELLTGREALGRFKLTVAKVYASNSATAVNLFSSALERDRAQRARRS